MAQLDGSNPCADTSIYDTKLRSEAFQIVILGLLYVEHDVQLKLAT
jgi:hypothetical protein